MATKLKNLKVKKVDFVDEGANPDAHIELFKRKDGKPEEDPKKPKEDNEEGEKQNEGRRNETPFISYRKDGRNKSGRAEQCDRRDRER